MGPSVQTLQDAFAISFNAYEESRNEAEGIWNQYHNRQYTTDQLAVLENRGQPAETFNVIKLFARMLLGYYSSTVNTITATPVQQNDIATASLLTSTIQYELRRNNFIAESDNLKLSAIIAGLACVHIDVEKTGEYDKYKRPIHRLRIEPVPDEEILRDPMSKRDDYSDARWIHRFRWITKEKLVKMFGADKVAKLDAYRNHVNVPGIDYDNLYNAQAVGKYKVYDNYLVVHTCIEDENGKRWSILWSADTILSSKQITMKEVRFPYRSLFTHKSNRVEYYGIFREVSETQRAINQALLKIQLLVNTQKAFVEKDAVDNMANFTTAFNRVSAVIPVKRLSGIRVESLSNEVADQYLIIDRALDRIQRLLSINDSFLGMAAASDSGRKVKLQQNATIVALRYLTGRIETMYRLLGQDMSSLIKQYYVAEQVIRVSDDITGDAYLAINTPMQIWSGQMDAQGQPIMEEAFEEVLDPATGKPLVDNDGNYVLAPIPEAETEFAFTDVDVEINSVAYNDEDEKNQLMLETMLNGPIGQLLASVNPSGFFKAASLSTKVTKTRYSPQVSQILEDTAAMLQQTPGGSEYAMGVASGQMGASQQANSANGAPMSQDLKLPQNTNEGPV